LQRGRHHPFGQERLVVDAQAGRLFFGVYIKARRTREEGELMRLLQTGKRELSV